MTTDLLFNASGSQAIGSESNQQESQQMRVPDNNSRLLETTKSVYRADQQAKFLDLHAEADSLLRQLQMLKQQRTNQEAVLTTADRY